MHYSNSVKATTSPDKRFMLKGSDQLIGDTFSSYGYVGELRYLVL